MSINLMIVDDSGAVRHALEELVADQRDIHLQASVGDPYAAAEAIKKKVPDVMILDIEMPKMDGITFLKKIMAQRPIPTIICSTLTKDGSPKYLEAMRAGAVDVVEKPNISTKKAFEHSKIDLLNKIRIAAESRVGSRPRKILTKTAKDASISSEPKLHPDVLLPFHPFRSHSAMEPLIAIGASTGGTVALEAILSVLPVTIPPIVVVQHMPEHFTAAFARRLNSVCAIHVKEAEHRERVVAGTAYIAPGSHHMAIRKMAGGYQIDLMDGPPITRHKPSVDILFRSVASAAGPFATGVILTGMGDDGAIGMKEMHQEGAHTIAQDENTCVVYGMPREAVNHGGVNTILPLHNIASAIIAPLRKR